MSQSFTAKCIIALAMMFVPFCLKAQTTVLTVENHSPYRVEISGLVGAAASANFVSPNKGTSHITAKSNWIGHLMLIKPGENHYKGNIVLRSEQGKLNIYNLYRSIKIKRIDNTLILEK